MSGGGVQGSQPELLLLHRRAESDVEPTLAGERAAWTAHVPRLLLTTLRHLICIAWRNVHAPPPPDPPRPAGAAALPDLDGRHGFRGASGRECDQRARV